MPFDARTRRVTGEATPITPANMSVSAFDLVGERHDRCVCRRYDPERRDMELWTTSLDCRPAGSCWGGVAFFSPRVSRDGDRVAVPESRREGLEGTPARRGTRVGRGEEQLLPPGPTNPLDWSADGERILHFCLSPDEAADALRDAGTTTATAVDTRPLVVDTDYAIWQGRFSPDGRWILFNAQSREAERASPSSASCRPPAASGRR